jgi:hypothetical protein
VEQNVAIDEQMIPFKSRHYLKQYLPSKPYPVSVSQKTHGHSDQVVSRDSEILVVKWLDKRLVHVASNFVGVGTEDIVAR